MPSYPMAVDATSQEAHPFANSVSVFSVPLAQLLHLFDMVTFVSHLRMYLSV